jgi:hypothetical protein
MRNSSLLSRAISLVVLILSCTNIITAQVTTATLSGFVKDSKDLPLASATVTLEYPDAGIKLVLITKPDGRFTIPNLRVGGPYKVTVEHVSYQKAVSDNLFLELGLNNSIEVVMVELAKELTGVTVASRSRIFDNKRTGASTNISNQQLRTLPTISRSADDYLRLNPTASATYNGLSFAGRNGQYNNYSLDGAVFNNPFGLDAPTPGGQTNAQPISLDAIDQIQVNIAPYDVTQAGFTGAGVNTVTRSGSNKFTGTVYTFFRNQSLTGKKVDGTKFEVPDLSQVQSGFALGGALRKDKLFYFLSFENEYRNEEATSYVARNAGNAGNTNTSRVLESDLVAVSNVLKTRFNYETGPYQGYKHKQSNFKWLAKIDWNISAVHKLTFTYNGLDASKEKPAHPSAIGRRGPDYTTLQFRNSGYEIVNKLNNFTAELKSNWKGNAANKLRVVYTTFRDKRNPFSTPFPVVNISKYGVRYIVAGHEPFSIHNRLNQDAFQVTNDLNIYRNNHSFTIGGSYESFKFGNSFNLVGYGPTLFSEADISTFLTQVPIGGPIVFGAYPLDVDVNFAKNHAAADKWTWYYVTVGQLSGYVQDEIQISKNFRLTLGIRVDKSLYFGSRYSSADLNADGTFKGTYTEGRPTIPNNDNLVLYNEEGYRITNGEGKDLDNTVLPSGALLSPRLGFNWDVNGNKSFQIRGGSGLFTGRFPFVWIGNHIGNPFSFFYNATAKDFRWPQVWRTNVGADWKAKFGTIFSADFAYTKDVKAMMVRNYRLGVPTGVLNSGTGDKRNIYLPLNLGTANTYVFTNTSLGYQYTITGQVQHSFKNGWFFMAGYNYLVAEDASSISAEISSDAFDRNPILNNANKARLTPSLYGNTHRILLVSSKKYNYGKDNKWSTTISFFSNWTSGNRFAYVYGGDINNDGTSSNDLLYVPTDVEIDAMAFAPLTDVNGNTQDASAQRAALKKFISQDEYLSGLRGKYTQKYGGETPWFGQFDIRLLQDLHFTKSKKGQFLQFSVDMQNIGNLISSKWGIREYATTSGYFQPVSVSLSGSTPTYQFDPSLISTFSASPDLQSRWQIQLGLRYNF